MKLAEFIKTKGSIRTEELFRDKELSQDVQAELIRLGLLDPPADGGFGPLSKLAGAQFVSRALNATSDGSAAPPVSINFTAAQKLKAAQPQSLFPVKPGNDLAGRVWRAMEAKGYYLTRVPGWINIVYLEGANADGSPNDNAPNKFNDRRLVLTVQDGKPVLLGNWDATTEPGRLFTIEMPNIKGAARIALGQFKAWSVGTHHGSGKDPHEALVLTGEIRIHRDLNKDFRRDGDAIYSGSSFGINQHWGFDMPVDNIGGASAGCLVGRLRKDHRQFMSLIKNDPRFRASASYRFMTAVIPAIELPA